jgi:heme-degrading monooxygenase HmoA
MITVGMNYRVLEGKQTEFEQKFAAVLDALRNAAGHQQSHLFQDVHDRTSYLITSEWSDETAFTDFIHSQTFKDVTNWGKETVLADRPQHRVYRH